MTTSGIIPLEVNRELLEFMRIREIELAAITDIAISVSVNPSAINPPSTLKELHKHIVMAILEARI